MIVDSHAYCFTAPDTLAGHPTVQDHLDLWQWGYAGHHQPAFRLRDRAPGDASLLLEAGGPDGRQLAPRPGVPGRPRHRAADLDGRRRRLHQGLPAAQHARLLARQPDRRHGLRGDRLGAPPRGRGAVQGRRVPGGLRPRLPGPAPLDGPGGRVADRDRAGRRHRRGDRGHRGPRPPRVQDHPRVRLPVRAGPDRRGRVVAAVLGCGHARSTCRSSSRSVRATRPTDARQGFLDELWTVARWMDRYPDAKVEHHPRLPVARPHRRRPDRGAGRATGSRSATGPT